MKNDLEMHTRVSKNGSDNESGVEKKISQRLQSDTNMFAFASGYRRWRRASWRGIF